MRRVLAIVLLALLPIQFSWAAMASYCGHEMQAEVEHFGHHEYQHHADAGSKADPRAGSNASLDASAPVSGDNAPGATHLDCGHCHAYCGVLLTLPPDLPSALPSARPSVALDESDGAHIPTRPERPQWLPLA